MTSKTEVHYNESGNGKLRRIHKIKTTITVRETYADEELEKLRDDCRELRNLAIIDVLNSTGIRVGELVNLDIDDINFEERECVVLGKGDKERIVYFDARTKLHKIPVLFPRGNLYDGQPDTESA